MPTIDVDGRGSSVQEAIADMWKRVDALEEKGYHPITSVEVVDTTKKQIVETFQLTDPQFKAHLALGQKLKVPRTEKPGRAGFLARIRMEF